MMALLERLRAIYSDARQLTTSVGRQSLEFGQSSLSTVREARSRARRHPIASISLISLCVAILMRMLRRRGAGGGLFRRRLLGGPTAAAAAGAQAVLASTLQQ